MGYSPWQDWVTNIPSLMMIPLQVFRKSTLWDKCLTLLKSKLLEKIIWLSLWHIILSRTEIQMVFTQISCLLSAFLVSFFQPHVLHIVQTFTLGGTLYFKKNWFFFCCFFFFMWTIFKVCIEFVTVLFLFYVLAVLAPGHVWSWPLTRDGDHTPCLGGPNLNHWPPGRSPNCSLFKASKYLQFSINLFSYFPLIFNSMNSKFA